MTRAPRQHGKWQSRAGGVSPPVTVLLAVVLLLFQATLTATERFEFNEMHMGVDVRIILYAPTSDIAEKAATEAFASFHTLNAIMSDYDSDSELSLLCASRGWIRVSEDLFTVLKAAKHYSTISEGLFDVTVGPMVRLWRRSRRQQELPSELLVERARQLVGNHLWEIDEKTQSVRLLKADMRFDLGAIAKGYAIDKAFEIIQTHGISSQLVDAGGDLRLGAPPPGSEGWRIARESDVAFLKNTALATSGGRFQFVVIDGVRYAHIVDPRTGLGMTGLQTVHVMAPTAMEADALATAVILLGKEKGQALIDTMPKVSMEFVEL
jgi:thiamine biosynthesis lipoprotein